ncbi:MAG TPA: FUSC family protein [Terriglobia bacterium]|nr:FUSC family protein [Terriglobia bacterium]
MSWFRSHRTQYLLGLRITAAGLLAYVLCPLFGLAQTYPAVLTAVIVMQGSVGASLKAMVDRFVGSLGGAVWAVAVLLALHHSNRFNTGMALVVALAPLALLAAFKPAYRAAPTAAIILLLTPSTGAGPLAPAIQRMLGIGLGSVVALVVALLVLPARAHGTFAESAGRAVKKMSALALILMKGLSEAGDPETIQSLHDDIRRLIQQAEAVADEVMRERATHLVAGPDPLPMCRALRRLRNDLAMIGRATAEPLPESIRKPLSEPTAATGSAIAEFLEACGEAISRQQPAPSIERCEKELAHFATTLTGLRRVGLLHELPDETVGRIFGLAFALEQLHQNLEELSDRIQELAAAGK